MSNNIAAVSSKNKFSLEIKKSAFKQKCIRIIAISTLILELLLLAAAVFVFLSSPLTTTHIICGSLLIAAVVKLTTLNICLFTKKCFFNTKEMNALHTTLKQTKNEKEDLFRQLTDTEANYEAEKKAKKNLEKKIEHLKQDWVKEKTYLEETKAHLTKELEKAQKAQQNLEIQIAEFHQKSALLTEKDICTSLNQEEILLEEKIILRKQLHQLVEDLSSLIDTNTALELQISTLQKDFSASLQTHHSISQDLEKAISAKLDAQLQFQLAVEENSSLKSQLQKQLNTSHQK